MKTITNTIRLDREFRQMEVTLREQLVAGKPLPILVNGLSGGASDAFLAELFRDSVGDSEKRNGLLLVADESEAAYLTDFLQSAGIPAYLYRYRDFTTYPVTASHDMERERLSVLRRLLSGGAVAVTTPQAAMQLTMPADELAKNSLSLTVGTEIAPGDLAASLLSMGFSRVDTVEGSGQFALRGGIFDLFVPGDDRPVRMEFFGDEIDRIGWFDPVTQRVQENREGVSLLPAREVSVSRTAQEKMKVALQKMQRRAENEESRATLHMEEVALENGLDLGFADKYISVIYDKPGSLLDYVFRFARPVIAVSGTGSVQEAWDRGEKAALAEITSLSDCGLLPGKNTRFSLSKAEAEERVAAGLTVHVNPFSGGVGSLRLSGLFGFRCRHTVAYGDNFSLLTEDLRNFFALSYRVLIAVRNPSELASLEERLREQDFQPERVDANAFDIGSLPAKSLFLTVAPLSQGFELMNAHVVVITTAEEGEKRKNIKKRTLRRILRKAGAGERVLSYAELSPGDYVVHDAHGIGQYVGLESMTIGGVTRDYITIRYAGTDVIHVPADRLDAISRYIGAKAEDGTVRLSKIGGTEWFHAKARAKNAAKDIAKDLIALYAERQKKPGFSFPEDGELERQFDNAFEFEETDPQLVAIQEIKEDMMKPCPMDRLLCGDVGFGKTEVALRAAFKAIVAGKQVAMLVPTTILALQHYETALSRMRGYPVTVEMLSRFRTAKEQEKILRRLKRGEIDMIIGTHALLGKAVAFKDLGLLIVDEEQRFGVAQKEKLKQMSTNIDVLTLTATPIPRTLNMAMSGIRDMSILDEAPIDRFPVQTYVMEHDDLLIQEAIRKELRRAGQVLYLYNRVERIDLVAGKLQKAIPEARVTYAHGQMEKDDLEEIWQSLVRGEIDVLVCTTIIETGVDLPNANTLIIEDADRMGLAQLHQIRGRVGRSGRRAYAYFTYRAGKQLSEIAEKRLSAIREFAEFGAGFRIALRDLEIRGAGNLLGAEQHGHIDAVGYEMYVRLLNEAILEEKGEKSEAAFESKVDIRMDALLPESYLASSAQRIEMYKKISLIETPEDLQDVTDELCDRFGEPPMPARRLLQIALCRAAASRSRIARVEQNGPEIRVYSEKIDLAAWSELFVTFQGLSFSGGNRPYVSYRIPKGKDPAFAAAELLVAYDSSRRTGEKTDKEKTI